MGIFSRSKRPVHLGKYPMEKIKRVDETTTRITNDVPRVPQRANFFMRARFGDLGSKPQREYPRFVAKYPLSKAHGKVMATQLPIHDGEVAPDKAPMPDSLQERAEHIKALCHFLDVDIVGICEVPEYAWYSHDLGGEPIEPRHKYAIVMLLDQGYETSQASSGDDWISGAQSFRAYLKGSTISATVAGYIRELGYEARAHSNADSQVLQLPLTLLAGLGELSRIGEVVLNPYLGPRFKTAVVTTSLPMATDKPIDFGLQDFCSKCKKCARECPPGAISFGDKVMFNGYEMWKPDVESCTRYRVTNPAGSGCGRCMKVCPFNKQGLFQHRIPLWFAINVPAVRKALIWLDDRLGFGNRAMSWKWWWDHEIQDGKVVEPKRTNQRDIRPNRPPSRDRQIPVHPAENNPPPGAKEPVPVNRRAARTRTSEGSPGGD